MAEFVFNVTPKIAKSVAEMDVLTIHSSNLLGIRLVINDEIPAGTAEFRDRYSRTIGTITGLKV